MRSLIVALFFAASAIAQNYYSAYLDGAQEVPPTATAGQGWGVVRLDTATNDVRIFVFFESLTAAPTAAHLHQGAVGVNGGVVVPLVAAGPNTMTGTAVVAPAIATAIAAGNTYLNVHTPLFPGGEIRGQVVPAKSTRFTGILSGAQEVPATGSAATGTAVAFLHQPDNRVVYIVQTNGLANVTAAHIHQAPAGVNGGVVVPLNGTAGNYCGVSGRLTAAQVTALIANGMYVNVHTGAFPGGEIRAQLLADAGDHFVAAMDGLQQVPPNATPALGAASLIVAANGTLTVQGTFAGLSGAPTAAHVHLGAPGVNGGVVFPLTILGSNLQATFTPTTANLADLRAGNWYVNVHTAAFPGGEIRGQLNAGKVPATFGGGCLGSNGQRPEIGATGIPVVGQGMTIDLYGGLPFGLALFVFGTSRDQTGPIPLPLLLTNAGINSPTCHLLVDLGTLLVQGTNGFGCAQQPLGVPFSPSLRGFDVYTQWFSIDPAANPGGFVASNALTLTIQ